MKKKTTKELLVLRELLNHLLVSMEKNM